jgi:hypothetical protein
VCKSIAILFFLLFGTFSGFFKKSFEKWRVAACRFSTEFCVSLKNESSDTKPKLGMALCCLEKSGQVHQVLVLSC